jgi:hypothetical protein
MNNPLEHSMCNVAFKGPLCRYSGTASSCDHTWPRCGELGNLVNFRGWRHVPSPASCEDARTPAISVATYSLTDLASIVTRQTASDTEKRLAISLAYEMGRKTGIDDVGEALKTPRGDMPRSDVR